MRVESFQRQGRCIDENAEDVVPCDSASAGEWEYYYKHEDFDKPALRKTGPGNTSDHPQCMGRVLPFGSTAELATLPTGLVPCDFDDNNDIIPLYRTVLAGEEVNIFQWSLDATDYCARVPDEDNMQSVCEAELEDEQQWRRYGDEGDATEISIRPQLALQGITDPEVAFQFFLFSAEGKLSRTLRAKTALLADKVERALPIIIEADETIRETVDLVNTVIDPAEKLKQDSNDAEKAFIFFGKLVKP